MLEQGLEAAKLSLRNQSGIPIQTDSKGLSSTNSAELHADKIGDANEEIFHEERPGWKGYVEWEDYPEKKVKAATKFAKYKFPPPPEFQLGPLPTTNPVLEGVRWKLWHKAIGGPLSNMPEDSLEDVIKASTLR